MTTLEELKNWIETNYKLDETIPVHRLLVKIGTLRFSELNALEESYQRGKNQINLQNYTSTELKI